MAFGLAKKLNMCPMDILTEWHISEVCVAYGLYRNEESEKIYYEWLNSPQEQKVAYANKYGAPEKHIVLFENSHINTE